ncbi:MAG: hypothetical protein AVDCRST_MAG34-217 [uncultured Nocardioidaceae bacterium]|uniref:DUF5666 domain-containing protein n=1 Tax=uncultured Nocardioidaceae bacterium TaxID=253824 RepID=A0A6J4LFM4_9ACTN|nr:MAG: hypothetical protein AVDCRST_MAG34-217 [uncultured Nocardioidaceae bacterium]
MNKNLAWLVAVVALTGCGSAGAGSTDGSGSVGGPAAAVTVEEARSAQVGDRLRVRGALVLEPAGAAICDALAESYPPQCPNGLSVQGLDERTLPPDAASDGGVTWVEQFELIAERTEDGLRYVDG